MANIEIYTKSWCPFCARAKADLDRKGVAYEEIDITTDEVRQQEMIERSHRRTVPQIFINGRHLGGSDDLRAASANGELDRLLSATDSRGEAA